MERTEVQADEGEQEQIEQTEQPAAGEQEQADEGEQEQIVRGAQNGSAGPIIVSARTAAQEVYKKGKVFALVNMCDGVTVPAAVEKGAFARSLTALGKDVRVPTERREDGNLYVGMPA